MSRSGIYVSVPWTNSARYNFILFYFILFYFILFYFILFYFILFYFILFYFILFLHDQGSCQVNQRFSHSKHTKIILTVHDILYTKTPFESYSYGKLSINF